MITEDALSRCSRPSTAATFSGLGFVMRASLERSNKRDPVDTGVSPLGLDGRPVSRALSASRAPAVYGALYAAEPSVTSTLGHVNTRTTPNPGGRVRQPSC